MAKSVLLVEDEDSIALALSFLMERDGYELRRVANGTDALSAIADAPPNLVLLDVMLPGASGYEVCQSIRLNPSLRDVKILMMTARGGEVERRKGLALGADAFLTKPFSTREVRGQIKRLLEDAGSDAPADGGYE